MWACIVPLLTTTLALQGTYVYRNGAKVEGSWENGEMDGSGVYFDADG